jgi:hypothetical protein
VAHGCLCLCDGSDAGVRVVSVCSSLVCGNAQAWLPRGLLAFLMCSHTQPLWVAKMLFFSFF